jgi:hypothetical protein
MSCATKSQVSEFASVATFGVDVNPKKKVRANHLLAIYSLPVCFFE